MQSSKKNENRYGIIIQARTSSTRLPGKVLMDIDGKPMLELQVERLNKRITDLPIIVATSNCVSDDPIQLMCERLGIQCFRGPLSDVMLRFIQCADKNLLTHIIRVGADDPLIDPNCCLALLDQHRYDPHDFMYASNRDGWPYGCAAELISINSLKKIRTLTSDPYVYEHTIPYFFSHPTLFKMKRVVAPKELRRPELALTVDYPEDLELIRVIFKRLRNEQFFSLSRVFEILDKEPALKAINAHLHQGFDK